jgi:WD40 repeat protein
VTRWLLALLVTGCGHPEAFSGDTPTAQGPFSTVVPRQLTFNAGTDRGPSWSADERLLVYSYEDLGRPVPDRCIGALPAEGGHRLVSACREQPAFDDSLDAFEWPATLDNRVAYSDATSGQFDQAPAHRYLVVADLAQAAASRRVVTFPYLSGTGRSHDLPLAVGWLNPTTLVYIGALANVAKPCQFCRSDTLYLGQDLEVLDLSASPPQRAEVPDTYLINALVPGADGRSVYYTIAGDSRVFHRDLPTGVVTTVYDFGLGVFVRDLAVGGGRIAVVLDGKFALFNDPLLGLVARDEGGNIVVVDLASGDRTTITMGARFFHRPALSPSGTRLVAEAYPFSINQILDQFGNPIGVDTAVSRSADLWLLEQ